MVAQYGELMTKLSGIYAKHQALLSALSNNAGKVVERADRAPLTVVRPSLIRAPKVSRPEAPADMPTSVALSAFGARKTIALLDVLSRAQRQLRQPLACTLNNSVTCLFQSGTKS